MALLWGHAQAVPDTSPVPPSSPAHLYLAYQGRREAPEAALAICFPQTLPPPFLVLRVLETEWSDPEAKVVASNSTGLTLATWPLWAWPQRESPNSHMDQGMADHFPSHLWAVPYSKEMAQRSPMKAVTCPLVCILTLTGNNCYTHLSPVDNS